MLDVRNTRAEAGGSITRIPAHQPRFRISNRESSSGNPGSDLEALAQLGDHDRAGDVLLEGGADGVHAGGLAVDEERLVDAAAGLLVPPGQVIAVGVAGEAVEDIDRG